MLLLSREDIKKVFTMKDAVEADKKAFQLMVGKAFRFVFVAASAVTVYFSIFARESILLLSG